MNHPHRGLQHGAQVLSFDVLRPHPPRAVLSGRRKTRAAPAHRCRPHVKKHRHNSSHNPSLHPNRSSPTACTLRGSLECAAGHHRHHRPQAIALPPGARSAAVPRPRGAHQRPPVHGEREGAIHPWRGQLACGYTPGRAGHAKGVDKARAGLGAQGGSDMDAGGGRPRRCRGMGVFGR